MSAVKEQSFNAVKPWLMVDVTTECNLRCKHCHHWTSKEPKNSLTTEEKRKVIRDFGTWKKDGVVLLAGGETLLKPDEVFALAAEASAAGLEPLLLTNLTLLREEWDEKLLTSGLKGICVSLDAPMAESYDLSRGVAGTFDKAVVGLRRLVAARKRLPSSAYIQVNTILKRGLLPHLPRHLEFVRSLGVDELFVFPLERTFSNSWNVDPYYEKERLLPDEETRAAFQTLHRFRREGPLLCNSEEDLNLIEDVIFGRDVQGRYACQAGDRNIVVDMKGNVRLCHLMDVLVTPGKTLGNVREAPLPVLCGEAAESVREIMRSCDQPCKLLSCNRKTVG